jgi:hypothetical protein
MSNQLTNLQSKILVELKQRQGYGTTSTTELAKLIETSSLAIYQSCRALERRRLVLHHPPKNRYSSHKWSISALGMSDLAT